MKKLIIGLIFFIISVSVYAGCKIYYETYTVNGKTYVCECMICDQFTECNCK